MRKSIEKGMKQASTITAKIMIEYGESIDKIMRYTRLNREEIEDIKREILN